MGAAAAAGGASPWGELLLRAELSQRREPPPLGGASSPRRAVASAAAAGQAWRSLLPADFPRRGSRTARHPWPWRVDRLCACASVSMGAAANHGCGHRRRRHYRPSRGSRPPQPRVVGGVRRLSFTSSAAAALPPCPTADDPHGGPLPLTGGGMRCTAGRRRSFRARYNEEHRNQTDTFPNSCT